MGPLEAFIPIDRLQALASHIFLPEYVSGTALFADISGFTPLTETLMKVYGRRVGPEELTRQLNFIYEALIAQVHRYGGSVISFSGDAITCWFDGDEGRRAATCAFDMQAAMARLPSAPRVAGKNEPLSIKIALAAGPARRLLAGDPDIQIIDTLAGSTLVRMAAAEKVAGKGEVIIGPEIKAQLGSTAQTLERKTSDAQQTFYVLTELSERAIESPWPDMIGRPLADEQLRPWLLKPIYERLRSSSEQFLAESRTATALFLKFGELDYDHDEQAAQKLDAFIRRVQRILEQQGGHLLQLTIGDKASYLYATFGALVAHADDAQRAIAAALQLASPPLDRAAISKVQIGLSQGRVFAGIYGGSTRRTFGVLGDDVNLAARLMAFAQPGQIIVSQHVFETAIGGYHFQYLGRIQIKGKTVLLPAYRVADEALTVVTNSHISPLVGRASELEQIDQLLASARAGQGRILRVSGAAGIGKSRLKAELIDRAAAHHLIVVQGICHSSTRHVIYAPWRQILSAMFEKTESPHTTPEQPLARIERIIRGLNPDWLARLPLLGELLGLPIPDNPTTVALNAPQRQAMLVSFVIDLWWAWASRQSIVIILEDAHWLDEASQQLTLALARALADWPILLALVHRPLTDDDEPVLPELNRSALHCPIDLDRLSTKAIEALIAQRLSGGLPPLAIDLIQRRTQGNPLFIEQLVDALCDTGKLFKSEDGQWALSPEMFMALLSTGCLEKRDDEWRLTAQANLSAADLDMPDSLHALARSRLDRLPQAHQLTLKVASVIGEEFDVELLARAHPDQVSRTLLREQLHLFEAHELLHLPVSATASAASSTHSFRHAILQEVAYDTLPEQQRRELHGAIGRALEDWQGDKIELLAYHYDRSQADDKAMFYLDKAAQAAQLKGVNRTALSYFTRALLRADKWEWRKGKVEAWHGLGERAEELAELHLLDAMTAVPPTETARLWSDYYEATGDYPQAQAQIERALSVYRQRPAGLGEVRCLNQLGAIAARQGEFDRARDCYRQALDLLGHKADRSPEETLILIRAWNGLGIAACQQSQYEDSRTHFTQALTLSRELGNRLEEAQALNNLGMLAAYQRDFDRAQQHHREALEIRRAIGHRAGEGLSSYNLAVAYVEAGSYAEAETFFKAALSIARALGNRWDEVNVLNGLGGLYLMLGRLLQAQTYLQKGLAVAQDIGDETGQAYALGNLGQVLRDAGDLPSAEKSLIDGMAMAHTQGDQRAESLWLSHLSTVSLQAGQIEQAIDQAKQALAMRQAIGLELWSTADLTTLASANMIAGDIIAASNYAEQAASILDAHHGEGAEFPHRDYYICYQVFFAAGQIERALAALQSAYRLVTSVTDKITDLQLRKTFQAIPVNREIISEYHRHWLDATQRIGNG